MNPSERAMMAIESLLPMVNVSDRITLAAMISAMQARSKTVLDADGRMRRTASVRRRIRRGVLRSQAASRARFGAEKRKGPRPRPTFVR